MFYFLILCLTKRKKNKPFKKIRIRLPLVPCFTQPHQGFTYIPSSQHYQSISGIAVADYSQFQTVTTEHTQSRVTGNRISWTSFALIVWKIITKSEKFKTWIFQWKKCAVNHKQCQNGWWNYEHETLKDFQTVNIFI